MWTAIWYRKERLLVQGSLKTRGLNLYLYSDVNLSKSNERWSRSHIHKCVHRTVNDLQFYFVADHQPVQWSCCTVQHHTQSLHCVGPTIQEKADSLKHCNTGRLDHSSHNKKILHDDPMMSSWDVWNSQCGNRISRIIWNRISRIISSLCCLYLFI